MNKKRILLLLITVLLGSAAVWYHHNRFVEQPQNQPSVEPEVVATVIEEEARPIELEQKTSTNPAIQITHNSITVKNNITDKMITYKKGFINYIPEFKISVNGIPLAREDQKTIEIPERKLKVTYSYDFANGYKTGTKSVIFSIPESLTEIAITFDWKNDWRVVVNGAEPLEIIE